MAKMCSEKGCFAPADVPHNKYWCKEHTPKESVAITEGQKWYNEGYKDGWCAARRSREVKE